MSKRNPDFICINTAMCLQTTLLKHNEGCCDFNSPVELRPYGLIAYVHGFESDKNKIEDIARVLKEEKNDDFLLWARNGRNIIYNYAELKLIYLMREEGVLQCLRLQHFFIFFILILMLCFFIAIFKYSIVFIFQLLSNF